MGFLVVHFQSDSRRRTRRRAAAYRRVFVPVGDLPIIDRKLIPVEQSDLETLIKTYNESRSPLTDRRQAELVESVYIAELIGSDLISSASRFRIDAPDESPTTFRFRNFSPALRLADFELPPTSSSERAVVSNLPVVGADGEATLSVNGNTDHWFGWSLRSTPESQPSKLHFQWKYPTCLDNRLFLKLPADWSIVRASTVARRVTDPATAIGDAWTFASATDSESANWWCLELSGSDNVEFRLEYQDPSSRSEFETLVLSEHVEYFLQPDVLETTTVFDIASSRSTASSWLVYVDEGLHVRSVMIDDASATWHRSKTDGCIEVIDRRSQANRHEPCKLKISGPAQWYNNDVPDRLPRYSLDKAFTLEGHAELAVHPDRQVNRLVTTEPVRLTKKDSPRSGEFQRWEFAWSGPMPAVRLESTPVDRKPGVESLSRLTNEADGMAFTGWALFNPEGKLESSCRLKLNSGWILESAQSTDRKQSIQVERIQSGDSTLHELRFNPPITSPVNVELRLRYPWTSGQDANDASRQVFEGEFPYRIDDWVCSNLVWIETVGRYKLEANTELLACRIGEEVVPEFQRPRLPRIGDVWLIEPHGTNMPRLEFVRQPSPYHTSLETLIYPGVDAPACVFRLQCTPLAGAVNFVTAELAQLPPESLRWRQRIVDQDGNETWVPAESRRITAKEASNPNLISESRQLLRIDLRNPMSDAFELEGQIDFSKLTAEPTGGSDAFAVPLLSFPEAAQQEAILQVDRRLSIAGEFADSPFIASGHAAMLDRFDGLRYRYNPILTTEVSIEPRVPESTDAWIFNAVSRLSVFIDGKTVLQFSGNLRRESSRRIEVRLPKGWSLVEAKLDKQRLDVSLSEKKDLSYIWMPSSPIDPAGSNFDLEFVGPKQSLNLNANLEFPNWDIDVVITDQHREVRLPPGFSLIPNPSRHSWFQSPTFELQRLLPSNWWQSIRGIDAAANLHLNGESAVADSSALKSIAPRLVWTSEHDFVSVGRDSKAKPMRIDSDESRRAFAWLRIFVGFAAALCVGWFRRQALSVGFVVLLGLLIVVAPYWLESWQQLSLGWLMGIVYRFVGLGINTPKSFVDSSKSFYSRFKSVRRNGESATKKLGGSGSGSSVILRGLIVLFSMAAIEYFSASWSKASEAPESIIEPFDIVIPLDEQGDAASGVVYVPGNVLQQLYQRPSTSNRGRILSAEYTLQFPSSSVPSNGQLECLCRLQVEIQTANDPFIWPLNSKDAEFLSMFVDGEETMLGSRLKWDEETLTWIPNATGVFEIELRVAPVLNRSVVERESVSLKVLPVGHARLVVEADELSELNTNGIGRLRNLRNGRHEVDMGAVSRLDIDWRPTQRNSKRMVLHANVLVEMVLTSGLPIAKSTIGLEDGARPWEEVDIECDAGWKPIGEQWGDAWLDRVSTTSSSNRMRYRLSRRHAATAEAKQASVIEIYWTKTPTNDPLIVVPMVELPMVAGDEPTLRISEDIDSQWKIDGLQGWLEQESTSGFEWMKRRDAAMIEYRSSMQAGNPFLRRVQAAQRNLATVESDVEFEFGRLHSRTSIRWSRPPDSDGGIGFEIPSRFAFIKVSVGESDVPFTHRNVETDHRLITIFPKSQLSKSDVVVIESEQPYFNDDWATVPIPIPADGAIETIDIHASRAVDRGFAWEGIDAPISKIVPTKDRSVRSDRPNGLSVSAWHWSKNFVDEVAVTPVSASTPGKSISSTLPRFRVDSQRPTNRGQAVLSLERKDEAWLFRLKGRVESGSNVCDGVLLEVPTFVADELQCRHRVEKVASPDAGRQLLYLFVDTPSPELPFEFELTSAASTLAGQSTTSFPEVRLLGNVEWQEWLVVPRVIEDQEARWLWSGARIDDQGSLPSELSGELGIESADRLVLTPTMSRPRVRLGNISAGQSDVVLSLVDHRFRAENGSPKYLRSTFWLVPRGHQEIVLNVPRGLEFQTAHSNGRTVAHHVVETRTGGESSSRLVRLRLLSSALPQQVNVYFAIDSVEEFPATLQSTFELPSIQGCKVRRSLVSTNFDLGNRFGGKRFELKPISPEAWITYESESSWDVVEQATGIIAEIPLRERTQWWGDWQAANTNVWLRTVSIRDQEIFAGISERRRKFCDRFQLAARAWETSSEQIAKEAERLQHLQRFEIVEMEGADSLDVVSPVARRKSGGYASGLLICVWLAVVCGMAYWSFGISTRWTESARQFLEVHPWWIWIVVGISAFLMMPTQWPGPAIIVVGLLLAVRTYILVRRRTQLSTR